MDNLLELNAELNNMAKRHVKVQTCWATAKAIDWGKKTMTATAEIDGLDYFDVQLGVGSFYRKPKTGTMCLIGIIENQEAATFLIDCEELDEVVYTIADAELTINLSGYIIKKGNDSLKTVINDFQTEVGKLCDELNKVVVAIGTGPNVAAITAIKNKVTGDIKNRFNNIFTA